MRSRSRSNGSRFAVEVFDEGANSFDAKCSLMGGISAVKSGSRFLIVGFGLLVATGTAKGQGKSAPQQTESQQGAADWRARMQQNHNTEQAIEQQVSRLTKDLELTPDQQKKVRTLAWEHHDRIQKILDTAPPTLTRADFTTQVHAISEEFHNSVNAILTPNQLELMKSMLRRLDTGTEHRRAP
jgi:hypothetical protein